LGRPRQLVGARGFHAPFPRMPRQAGPHLQPRRARRFASGPAGELKAAKASGNLRNAGDNDRLVLRIPWKKTPMKRRREVILPASVSPHFACAILLPSGRADTRCSVCRVDPGSLQVPIATAPGTGLESEANEPSGFIFTTILGIVGAFVASWLGQVLGWYHPGEGAGLIGAVVGAIIVLLIWGAVIDRI
jgi:uncharacterized membrane protein YeaQ/YmgE (transglycosylase-associated protein family)